MDDDLGREDRSERKTREILAAAKRRFAANGYAATGMEGVARDARISTATLYAVFPGKADLFRAVVAAAMDDFKADLVRETRAEGEAEDRLRAFAAGYARFLCDPFARSVFRLIVAERKQFQDTAERFYAAAQREFGGGVMTILTELKDAGRLHAPSLSRAAGQLLGMIEHPCLVRPMLTGDDSGCKRSAEEIAEEALGTFHARYARAGAGAAAVAA